MSSEENEQILPQLRFIAPIDATDEQVEAFAQDSIRNALGIEYFEILKIHQLETGTFSTEKGDIVGKRFLVAFRKLDEIVYVHPEYEQLVH